MLNRIFGLYTGAQRLPARVQPVCTRRPKCHQCLVSNYCSWFRYHADLEDKQPRRVKTIKQMAEEERPRERLATVGPENLTDSELLAIIIRTGSGDHSALDLARLLLERFVTLGRIDQASITELSSVHGIGPAKGTELKAALELGKRLFQEIAESDQMTAGVKLYQRYRSRLLNVHQESFYIVLLNTKNRIIREILVSRGTLESSLVHPREVFKEAIRESASAVIFVHNHPSGDPQPSSDDIELTERLVKAGKLLGIRVLDHVIIGRRDYYSFAEGLKI